MKRHTWTTSQEPHKETRDEFMNRFRRTLVYQCTEAARGENIDIRELKTEMNKELVKRGFREINDTEYRQIISLVWGCDFYEEEPSVYWK